jgi:hypothetical protein
MGRFFVRLKFKEANNIRRQDVYYVEAQSSGDAISVAMADLVPMQREQCYESSAHRFKMVKGKAYIYGYDNFGLHDPLGYN